MYLNKKNLLPVSMLKADADIPGLNNIHVREDGSTVASNGVSCLLVSPIRTKVKKILKKILKKKECGSVTLTNDTVKDIVKNLPSVQKYGGMTEHCSIEDLGEGNVEIFTTDGVRGNSIRSKVYRRPYINYKVFLQSLHRKNGVKVVLNLSRLLLLLQTIDKIIKTSDEDNAIFIEFTDKGSVIIRGMDSITGQRVVGIMNQYNYNEQQWLKENEWEESLVPEKVMRHKKS